MGRGSSADLNPTSGQASCIRPRQTAPRSSKESKVAISLNVPTGPAYSTSFRGHSQHLFLFSYLSSASYLLCPMLVLPANCRAGLLPQNLGEGVLGSVEVDSLSLSFLLHGCMCMYVWCMCVCVRV